MSNRRPATLLIALIVTAAIGFTLAVALDEHQGWNHPGQFVANVSWIVMLLAVLGFVVTGAALIAKSLRHHDSVR